MTKKIPVTLTVDDWNALYTTAQGELEAMTGEKPTNPNEEPLRRAMKRLRDARKAAV